MTEKIFVRLLRTMGWTFLGSLVLFFYFIDSLHGSPLFTWAALFVALLGSGYALLGNALASGAYTLLLDSKVDGRIHYVLSVPVAMISAVLLAFCGLFSTEGWAVLVAGGLVLALTMFGGHYLGRSIAARYGQNYEAERREKLWRELVTEVTDYDFFEPDQQARLLNYYQTATSEQLIRAIVAVAYFKERFPT